MPQLIQDRQAPQRLFLHSARQRPAGVAQRSIAMRPWRPTPGVFSRSRGAENHLGAIQEAQLGAALLLQVDAPIKRANSASVSKGMTTSSFSLKAFVRRANGAQPLAVRPEALGLGLVPGSNNSVFGCRSRTALTRATPRRGLLLGMAGYVDQQHRLWFSARPALTW